MKYISQVVLLFLFLFCTSCSGNGKKIINIGSNAITGKVIHIIDGDTYDLLTAENKTIRVRMSGIDAPERGMAFYKVSKNFLGSLCNNKTVKLVKTDTDQYGRTVGFTYLEDGRELGHEMIKAGLAWHFKKYNSDKDLSDLEFEARKAKRGLWFEENPMAPWDNRKLHRQGIST